MILRTNTYLQFGQGVDSLGAVLMLNPGSAMPASKIDADKLITPDRPVMGMVRLDPTMEQIVKLANSLYFGRKLEGRLQIYNLFSYREGGMDQFKKTWNGLTGYQRSTITEKPLLDDLKKLEHPWIVVGWGCDQPSDWKEHKEAWLDAIKEARVPKLGWKNPRRSYDYYHPCPQRMDKRQPYIDYIVTQYNNLGIYPRVEV